MNISEAGLKFVETQEGFFPFVYDDLVYPTREWKGGPVRGTLTIGYGHTNAAKHPLKISQGLTVTQPKAQEILDVDMDGAEEAVNRLVKVPLTQGQFDALASFCFNCGEGNLAKLIVPLNDGDYDGTRAKFMLYTRSKGKVLKGLVSRRQGEVALWDTRVADAQAAPTNNPLPSQVDAPAPAPAVLSDHVVEKVIPIATAALTATVDWKLAAVFSFMAVLGMAFWIYTQRRKG